MSNITYSHMCTNADNSRMKVVYESELPHFLEAIKSDVADIRYTLPDEMVRETVETSRGGRWGNSHVAAHHSSA